MITNKDDAWNMNNIVDEDFGLEIELGTNTFELELNVNEEADDFFQEFNKPSNKKLTKQERIHEYKKINTKMPNELHRMLKTYCSQNDIKKNDAFSDAVTVFMDKHKGDNEIPIYKKINGIEINAGIESNLKKPFNFEVGTDLFKQVKTFASMRDLKMINFYEQAIIYFLNIKKFKF